MSRPLHRSARRQSALLGVLFTLAVLIGALLPPVAAPTTAQAAAGQPAANPATVRAAQERIDAYVQERMAAWSVPGLSLATWPSASTPAR